MRAIATIGYQTATMRSFLRALSAAKVELVVDIRAVASSRRPGFSKSALAASLREAGIDYEHLRALGTPAEGRAAARGGRFAVTREIYLRHMDTPAAQAQLTMLAELVQAREVCLLCFEADPAHCHRSIVVAELAKLLPVEVTHLMPEDE